MQSKRLLLLLLKFVIISSQYFKKFNKQSNIKNYFFLRNEEKNIDLSSYWMDSNNLSLFKNNIEIENPNQCIVKKTNINVEKEEIMKNNQTKKYYFYKEYMISIEMLINEDGLLITIKYSNRGNFNSFIYEKNFIFDFYYPIKTNYDNGNIFIFCEFNENNVNNQITAHHKYIFIICDLDFDKACISYFMKFGTLTFFRHVFNITLEEVNNLLRDFEMIYLENKYFFILNSKKKLDIYNDENSEKENSYAVQIIIDHSKNELDINKVLGRILIDKIIKNIILIKKTIYLIISKKSLFIINKSQVEKLIFESSKKAKYLEIDKNYVSHYLNKEKKIIYLVCDQNNNFIRYEIYYGGQDIVVNQSSLINSDNSVNTILYLFEAEFIQLSIYKIDNLTGIHLCLKYNNIFNEKNSDCILYRKLQTFKIDRENQIANMIYTKDLCQIRFIYKKLEVFLALDYPYAILNIKNDDLSKYSIQMRSIDAKPKKFTINAKIIQDYNILKFRYGIDFNGLSVSRYTLKLNIVIGNFIYFDPLSDFKTHKVYYHSLFFEVMVNPIVFFDNINNVIIFQFYGKNKYYFYKFDTYLNLLEHYETPFSYYMKFIASISEKKKLFIKTKKDNIKYKEMSSYNSVYYFVKDPYNEKFLDLNSDIIQLSCKKENLMFYSVKTILLICLHEINSEEYKFVVYAKESKKYFKKLGQIQPNILDNNDKIVEMFSFKKLPQTLIILTHQLFIKFINIEIKQDNTLTFSLHDKIFDIQTHLKKTFNLPQDVIIFTKKNKNNKFANYCQLKINLFERRIVVLMGCKKNIERKNFDNIMQKKDFNNNLFKNEENELNLDSLEERQFERDINLDENLKKSYAGIQINKLNTIVKKKIEFIEENEKEKNKSYSSTFSELFPTKLISKNEEIEQLPIEKDEKIKQKKKTAKIVNYAIVNFYFDKNLEIKENFHFDIEKLMPQHKIIDMIYMGSVPSINVFLKTNNVLIYYIEVKKVNRLKSHKFLLMMNPYSNFHGSMPYLTPIDIHYKQINPIRVELDNCEKTSPRFFFTKMENEVIVGLYMIHFFRIGHINLEKRLSKFHYFVNKFKQLEEQINNLKNKNRQNKSKLLDLDNKKKMVSLEIDSVRYGEIYNFFDNEKILNFDIENLIFENQDKIIIYKKDKYKVANFMNNEGPFFFEMRIDDIYGNINNYEVTSEKYVEKLSKEIYFLPLIKIIPSTIKIIPNMKEYKFEIEDRMLFIYNSNFLTVHMLNEGISRSHIINHLWSIHSNFSKQMFSSYSSRSIFLNKEKQEIYQILCNHFSIYISVFNIPKKNEIIKRKNLIVLNNSYYWNSRIKIKQNFFIIRNMNSFFFCNFSNLLENKEQNWIKIVTEGLFFNFYFLKIHNLKIMGFVNITESAFWYTTINFSKKIIYLAFYLQIKNNLSKMINIEIPAGRFLANSKIQKLKIVLDEQNKALNLFIFKYGQYHYMIKISYLSLFNSNFNFNSEKETIIPIQKLQPKIYLLSNVNINVQIEKEKTILVENYLFIYQKYQNKESNIIGYNLNLERKYYDFERFFISKKDIIPTPKEIYGTYLKYSNNEFKELSNLNKIVLVPKIYKKSKFFRFLITDENKQTYFMQIEKTPTITITTPDLISKRIRVYFINDFNRNYQNYYVFKTVEDKNHIKESLIHLSYLVFFTLSIMIMIKLISKFK